MFKKVEPLRVRRALGRDQHVMDAGGPGGELYAAAKLGRIHYALAPSITDKKPMFRGEVLGDEKEDKAS